MSVLPGWMEESAHRTSISDTPEVRESKGLVNRPSSLEPDADGWVYAQVDFDSPLARRAGLLAAATNDLCDVLEALERLHAVPADDALARSAWWSFVVVRYARLFNSGRRRSSVAPALKATFREVPAVKQVHGHLLGLRNKHVAHDDGHLDEEGVVIEIRIRNGNELQRRPRAFSGGGVAPRGPFLDGVRVLAEALRTAVEAEYNTLAPALHAEVDALPGASLAVAPRSQRMTRTSIPLQNWRDSGAGPPGG